MVTPLPARSAKRQAGPLYRQIERVLADEIGRGALAVGAELATEAHLAARFGVSLITVRQALRELQAAGLIRKRPAKTAVVAAAEPRQPSWALNSFGDIIAHTRNAQLTITSWQPERSVRAAEVFGLTQAERCPCLRAQMAVGGQPESDITIYFAPHIGARLARSDFDDVVVFRSVQRRLGLHYAGARVTVRAEVAGSRLARKLEYRLGGPILVNEIVFVSTEEEPLELTIARHRADLYRLSYDLRREPD